MDPSPFWCSICRKDLQSQKSLKEHESGRKHQRKLFDLDPNYKSLQSLSCYLLSKRHLPLEEEGFFADLAAGNYKNIVVLTGAGISTNAGVPDYRSRGGFFDQILKQYSERFPEIGGSPEVLFSRAFANRYPDVWNNELLPTKQRFFKDIQPTKAHRFLAYLHHRKLLKRIYTQNIDGLHLHSSLNIPPDKVVECHGSIQRPDTLVLYGDELPAQFSERVLQDFGLNAPDPIDLMIVLGTSLQVAPFCGLPNMVPKGATRVLVNRNIGDCLVNCFSETRFSTRHKMDIGGRKNVKLEPLWTDRKARSRWRQLLVETDCDTFVDLYCQHTRETIN